jgi:hypothetical protein
MTEKTKVIIAGTRTFDNYQLLKTKCNEILKDFDNIEIVSGTSKGADILGEQYAKEMNFDLKLFKPDWNGLGRKAGHLRNIEMGNYGDVLIAFWDNVSGGTKHMITYAQSKGLKVYVINY